MICYFLLVYNQRSGELEIEDYAEAAEAALDRRFQLERENRDRPHIEVVVLSAESREALTLTHGRYFKSIQELAAAF